MDTNLKIFALSKSHNVLLSTANIVEDDLNNIFVDLKSDFDSVTILTRENHEMKVFIRTKNLKNLYFMKMSENRGTVIFTFKDEILNLTDILYSDYKSIFKKLEFTTKNRFLSKELMNRARYVLGKEQ